MRLFFVYRNYKIITPVYNFWKQISGFCYSLLVKNTNKGEEACIHSHTRVFTTQHLHVSD